MTLKQFSSAILEEFPDAVLENLPQQFKDKISYVSFSLTVNVATKAFCHRFTDFVLSGTYAPDPEYQMPVIKSNRVANLKILLRILRDNGFSPQANAAAKLSRLVPLAVWMDSIDPEDTPYNELYDLASDYMALTGH